MRDPIFEQGHNSLAYRRRLLDATLSQWAAISDSERIVAALTEWGRTAFRTPTATPSTGAGLLELLAKHGVRASAGASRRLLGRCRTHSTRCSPTSNTTAVISRPGHWAGYSENSCSKS